MSQPTVKVAVVGCGAIAREHLRFLTSSAAVYLVGVCDTSPVTAQYTADQTDTQPFTDLSDMLDSTEPEIVHVLTPPMSHPALAMMCLEAGADVICEKPLGRTGAEVADLLSYARDRGRMLIEGQNLRWNDEIVELRRLIERGVLGDIVGVDIVLALPIAGDGSRFADTNVASPVAGLRGGAIHDFLPHMAYLALDPLDYPAATDVAATWTNVSGNRAVGYDRMVAHATLGAATATLTFDARIHPTCFRVAVRGTSGTYETDLYRPYKRIDTTRKAEKFTTALNHLGNGLRLAASGPRDIANKIMQHSPYHGLDRMLAEIYETRASGTECPISPEQIAATAEFIDALVASTAEPGGNNR